MSRAEDLRADYDELGRLLPLSEGAAAAAIARERRLIGELLEQLETPAEVSKVDELAKRRGIGSESAGGSRRRGKSRRG